MGDKTKGGKNKFDNYLFIQATKRVKEHAPCGFAYKVVTQFDAFKKPVVVHRDDGRGDVASIFVRSMYEEYDRLHDLIWAEEPMTPLTDQEKWAFNSSRECYLCNQPLVTKDKVRDHCHYT